MDREKIAARLFEDVFKSLAWGVADRAYTREYREKADRLIRFLEDTADTPARPPTLFENLAAMRASLPQVEGNLTKEIVTRISTAFDTVDAQLVTLQEQWIAELDANGAK